VRPDTGYPARFSAQPVLGIRTFLQDPDPEIFHRIRIPDPDPDPTPLLKVLTKSGGFYSLRLDPDPGSGSGFFQRSDPDPVKMDRIRQHWAQHKD
jgi:hypothetical protein